MSHFCQRTLCILMLFAAALSSLQAQNYTPQKGERGIAVFYADYLDRQPTAMGETYYKNQLTCSHPWHPQGTLLKVTRQDNGQSVTVRVNDRGNFSGGVIISLSYAAAAAIDLIRVGRAWVTVEAVGYSEVNPASSNNNLRARTPSDVPQPYSYGSEFTPKGVNNYEATSYAPTYRGPQPNTFASGYGIQLGAYTVYDNALRRLESLQKQGLNSVSIRENQTAEGNRIYRVIVGTFASRTDAETYLNEYLKASLIADGVIVTLR